MLNIQKLMIYAFGIKDASKEEACPAVSVPLETETDEAEALIRKICSLHSRLRIAEDLKPGAAINAMFEELVAVCTQTLSEVKTKKILNDERIRCKVQELRKYCATGEYHLETQWAVWIADAEDEKGAAARLEAFPYFSNYMDLTYLELVNLHAVMRTTPERVAFIGSGPLPLSSLCVRKALKDTAAPPFLPMASKHDPVILNIDQSAEAIQQSSDLCRKLGQGGEGMAFLCAQAGSNQTDLRAFDVVYVAALVGSTQGEKESMLAGIVEQMNPGSFLIIRTAHALRSLIYPVFNARTENILGYLELCGTVHPDNHIVNSFIIGRVKKHNGSVCSK